MNQPDARIGQPPLFVTSPTPGARPLIGIHGWNGSHRTFDPLLGHLPEELALHTCDLPGYGRSAPPESWTLDSIGTRVARALQPRLPAGQPVDFIGNCSGAAIALYVARALESPVGRLYFIEPFAFVPWYLRLFLVPAAGPFVYRATFDTALGRRLTDAALAGKRDEETDMLASFADTPVGVPLRYLQLLDAVSFPPDPADIPADPILIEAEHTFGAVRRSVEMWESVWPEAQRRPIANGGHLVLEEAPGAVADIIEHPGR